MAQRKLKIGLASSVTSDIALASIFLDNQLLEDTIAVLNTLSAPLIREYTFEATGIHELKVVMNNDKYEEGADLNLIISYVALSNEDGTYPAYTYLVNNQADNCGFLDPTYLITSILWTIGSTFTLTFDINNLTTWFDYRQQSIDSQQPPIQ